jgi:hypothetical protein
MTRSTLVASFAAATLALAAASADAVNILVPGQKAFGVIGVADEVDSIYFRADAGWVVSFTLKARKGETLLPVFDHLEDPDGDDALPLATVKVNAKGTLAKLKFTAGETGTWKLGIAGDAHSTGIWDLASKGPKKIPLGSGTVASPGLEVPVNFDADEGTEATIQVKAAVGSLLNPLVDRLERPDAAGPQDLSLVKRTTSKKSDTLKKIPLADNGTWTLVVTGANSTTGDFVATLQVGKKIPLDFSVDPPVGPPPTPTPFISSVTPPTVQVPGAGTASKTITVGGSGFVDGCTTTIDLAAGTNGISNVVTTFQSSTSLSVQFDLDAAAAEGFRDLTVTNPDLKNGTRADAFRVLGPIVFGVSAVTPSGGPGAGGTRVLVQGQLFNLSTATVSFGGIPAQAVNVVDAQNILCTVPPAAAVSVTAGTPVDVLVDNGSGQTDTLAGGFTYDPDPVRPFVASAVPATGATGVATNLVKTVLVLSEPMATGPATTNANYDFFRSGASGPNDVSGVPSRVIGSNLVFGRMVVIQRNVILPAGGNFPNLSTNSIYVAQIHSGGQTTNLLTDVAGNVFDATPFAGPVFQTTFTTGAATDATAPTATSVPANGATGVDVDAIVLLSFSEAIDPTTLAASIQLRQGMTGVPFDMDIDPICRNVTVTPRAKLSPATPYTITATTGVRDLAANPMGAAFNATFTTGAADGTAPTDTLTVDALPPDQNGSTTFAAGSSNGGAPSGSGAPTAFDAYLPRSGFTLDVAFADSGGSGIDPSSFSCTCSAAMGATGAGSELASNFAVTALGATWTVDAGHALAAGSDVTFTVDVSDYAGNAAATRTLTVDVADITKTPAGSNGTPGTDRDPFNARQAWLLRFDQDIYAISASAGGSGAHPQPLTVNSSLGANGTPDFREDLTLIGLNGPQSGTGASTVTNGSDTGTNAIVQRMVREATRGWLNRRYGVAYDGTHSADSVEIEFLLEGETKSTGGTVTAAGWNGSAGYSMMTFTGDERANSSGGTIGRAFFDPRNRNDEDDSNTGNATGNNIGTFATHMIRVRLNDPLGTAFPTTFDPFISLNSRGGTPVGNDNLDAVVLDDSFVYASGTAPQKARFDLVQMAVQRYAMYLSAVGAHEIGHSTGLVQDGAPPNGIFGNAHPNNTFVASGQFTTVTHLDVAGRNLMEAASSFDDAIAAGSEFMLFEPLSLAYMLRRHIYDQ